MMPAEQEWIDLQINGLQGVDFNASELTDDDWGIALAALRRDGTAAFLPTLITDRLPALQRKLTRLASLCRTEANSASESGARPLGIHLEGPFLSNQPGFVGAHPAAQTIPATLDVAKRLVEWGEGQIRLVTLAPERDPRGEVVEFLANQGILVAAGHTDASRDQLQRAIDHGLSLFTHLGNGCPMQLHRHDNILNRVLRLRDRLRITLIADGAHVPYWLLESWVEWWGASRVAVVSDAISAAGMPPGTHRLANLSIEVGHDGVPRSEEGGHLVGSGATLGTMAQRLEQYTGLSVETRKQLLQDNAWSWLTDH